MEYEGQICRSPFEKSSFMLPVMVGCTYNACKFCTLFRHLDFRVLPLEQVEAELKRVHEAGGVPRKIFLGDGNAFDLPTDYLLQIIELIHRYFPECYTINMDATVSAILAKSDDELERLSQAGVRYLYLGIEAGLPDVLEFMNKEHTQDEAREAIRRIQDHGMLFAAHVMTGISGRGRGKENALALAEFFNETKPAYTVNFSLFLHGEAPLYREIQKGTWDPAPELENLEEDRAFLQALQFPEDGSWTMGYDGFHDFVRLRVHGELPRDRERMIAQLDKAIAQESKGDEHFSFVCFGCGEYSTLEDVHVNVDLDTLQHERSGECQGDRQ